MTSSATTPKRRYSARTPAAERREQLLDAALEIINTDGVAAVSVDGVAKACGVTRPVVYGQFTDANHILRDLLHREGERALAQIAAVLPGDLTDADPVETFTQVAAGLFAAVTASPQRWRSILLPVDGSPPPVRNYKQQAETAVRARIAEITRWFIREQPDADTIDVDLLAHLLLTAMEEGSRLILNDPDTYPPERLTAMARFMVETFFNRGR
ncbi:DNA-binding transcriptional regulator, AcrR family [Actinokineospora alba]|uniref:DNA-binding transcriptional regulator, AcrR family n=1 Tax=Actinokineospora alba TaxID=504798 RepID=A0A1H0IA74_9PSEU|nr:TetR/AcrR family transcriptional regulator [Actinokineospora alba]TDP64537.1 TetR family transcriptional regulator [Actinokineospora alba]SDI87728.1 DNA-binding transcriptional regulator, AcrR family [Actinokineospora alba]SDO28302.1 DNA-binding transcriptional regulator, AcrR family [Actinokineospora alba]